MRGLLVSSRKRALKTKAYDHNDLHHWQALFQYLKWNYKEKEFAPLMRNKLFFIFKLSALFVTSTSPYPLKSFGLWFERRFACSRWRRAPSSWRYSLSECLPPKSVCRNCVVQRGSPAECECHTPSPRLWDGSVVCPCSSYREISCNLLCYSLSCKVKVSAPLSDAGVSNSPLPFSVLPCEYIVFPRCSFRFAKPAGSVSRQMPNP